VTDRYRCGLCDISPSRDPFTGDKATVREHIEAHNVLDVSLYLTRNTEQATL
jgi:hypothetical protein